MYSLLLYQLMQLYFPIGASFDEKQDTPRLLAAIKKNAKVDVQIHKTEIVKRDPLMYYRPNKEKYTRFIKIYCGSTAHQNAIARILEMSDQHPDLEDMMHEGKLYDLTVRSLIFEFTPGLRNWIGVRNEDDGGLGYCWMWMGKSSKEKVERVAKNRHV